MPRRDLPPPIPTGPISAQTAETLNRMRLDLYRLVGGFSVSVPMFMAEDAAGVRFGVDTSGLGGTSSLKTYNDASPGILGSLIDGAVNSIGALFPLLFVQISPGIVELRVSGDTLNTFTVVTAVSCSGGMLSVTTQAMTFNLGVLQGVV